MKRQILFVDDEQLVLDSLERMLHAQHGAWEMTFLTRPEEAWEQLLEKRFDAVVADVKMPGLGGLELLERIKQTKLTRDIPVVILTGLSDCDLKRQALDRGAADLLNKPVQREDLLSRLQSVLQLKSYQDELRMQNDLLERRVQERTAELFRSRLDIIWRLGKAAEQRDEETGNHVIRVGCMSRAIAEALKADPVFVETLFLAAPLHDIGKIGIPDTVLLKRGPYSPGERAMMEHHCLIGARILREDCRIRAAFLHWRGLPLDAEASDSSNPLLEMAATVALTHHEKWDGSGYPQGLVGEAIPLEARIVAVADVFDALTSQRPYKKPYGETEALRIIEEAAGTHFDPRIQAAFVEALPDIRSIRERFGDTIRVFREMEETWDEEDLVCR